MYYTEYMAKKLDMDDVVGEVMDVTEAINGISGEIEKVAKSGYFDQFELDRHHGDLLDHLGNAESCETTKDLILNIEAADDSLRALNSAVMKAIKYSRSSVHDIEDRDAKKYEAALVDARDAMKFAIRDMDNVVEVVEEAKCK